MGQTPRSKQKRRRRRSRAAPPNHKRKGRSYWWRVPHKSLKRKHAAKGIDPRISTDLRRNDPRVIGPSFIFIFLTPTLGCGVTPIYQLLVGVKDERRASEGIEGITMGAVPPHETVRKPRSSVPNASTVAKHDRLRHSSRGLAYLFIVHGGSGSRGVPGRWSGWLVKRKKGGRRETEIENPMQRRVPIWALGPRQLPILLRLVSPRSNITLWLEGSGVI